MAIVFAIAKTLAIAKALSEGPEEPKKKNRRYGGRQFL
jgi:hypothetical protein